MSSIGINNNTFRITGKYLDLLNDFAVRARINHEVDEVQKEHLIDFMLKLKDENNTQPQFQLLSNIIERELRSTTKDLVGYLDRIIDEVKANNTQQYLPKITFLADILDSESSEALLKIMGE